MYVFIRNKLLNRISVMKSRFQCLVIFLVYSCHFSCIQAQEWLDMEGNYINAHGGCIVHYDDRYYWFGEHRPEKGFSTMMGVNCYSSVDLITWQHEGIALAVSSKLGSDIERGCIIERPKVIYNPKTEKFVMWFHLELKGQGYGSARAGVAVADKITGPFRFVRSGRVNAGVYPLNMTKPEREIDVVTQIQMSKYKWWTPQWYDAVNHGFFIRQHIDGGQMSRDMTLFVDDDGRAYHIYSSEENLTLHIAELGENYLVHTGRYIRLFPGGHNEAPAVFKHGNTYWMIASGCTGWNPNAARLFSAPSIWGPWKQHPNPCRGEQANKTFEAQSNFVLHTGDQYLFMADIWKPKSLMYSGHLQIPIRWDENGVPYLENK